MSGMFIDIQVDGAVAADQNLVKKLIEVCPVGIFGHDDKDELAINDGNIDECVLCDLCLEAAPEGSIRLIKLYESS